MTNLNHPDKEQHQYHLEISLNKDRSPQLNCTICGRRSGFCGCPCFQGEKDGSDSDQAEATSQTPTLVDEPEVLGNDLESVQVNTKCAAFVYNKDGFHIKDGFNDEVAKDLELSRTFEELLLDHGEGAKTPTYMDHQCETEMSMTSSDVRSWGSYSSGALVNGVGQWVDEGPTPKYPELIANEDMMEP